MGARYIIIAGTNGAGKTTLYETDPELFQIPRVNVDEIVREFGSWRNFSDVMKAGRIALKRINDFFDNRISFNQETTLCGHLIRKNVKRAKELGYEVVVYYIGLDSAELAVERVRQRVENGGHGIPEGDIRRRYEESLNALKELNPLCDFVRIYDNTDVFRMVACINNGENLYKVDPLPDWCQRIFEK